MGLSTLIQSSTTKIAVEVSWGDYTWEDPAEDEIEPVDQGLGLKAEESPQLSATLPVTTTIDGTSEAITPAGHPTKALPNGFRRKPRQENVPIVLPLADGQLANFPVPNSNGLRVAVTLRPVAPDSRGRIPPGTHALCVFLINGRDATEKAYQGNAFQARLRVTCHEGFVARPDLRGCSSDSDAADWDSDVADLQYRQIFDYVSGIGCFAEPVSLTEEGPCTCVQTCWTPSAEVEFVGHLDKAKLPGVELGMEALAEITSLEDARNKLGVFPYVE
jgi:hypothetical protein